MGNPLLEDAFLYVQHPQARLWSKKGVNLSRLSSGKGDLSNSCQTGTKEELSQSSKNKIPLPLRSEAAGRVLLLPFPPLRFSPLSSNSWYTDFSAVYYLYSAGCLNVFLPPPFFFNQSGSWPGLLREHLPFLFQDFFFISHTSQQCTASSGDNQIHTTHFKGRWERGKEGGGEGLITHSWKQARGTGTLSTLTPRVWFPKFETNATKFRAVTLNAEFRLGDF